MTDLPSIPNEQLLPILVSLNVADLLNFCQTNKQFREFCQSDYLWQQKTFMEYDISDKPADISWKQYYIRLSLKNIKNIDVFYKDSKIGSIWIEKTDTIGKIKRKCTLLLKSLDPEIVNSQLVINATTKGIYSDKYIMNTYYMNLENLLTKVLVKTGMTTYINLWESDFNISIYSILYINGSWQKVQE